MAPRRPRPTRKLPVMAQTVDQETVSLLRWLRRQLRQPTPGARAARGRGRERRPGRGAAAARAVRLRRRAAPARRGPDRPLGESEPWRALRTRRSSATSSTPSLANRASRCATCSPHDATWVVPGSGSMAGTFTGREEIFALPRPAAEGDRRHVCLRADRRARLGRPGRGALPRERRAQGPAPGARPGAAVPDRGRARPAGARAAERRCDIR